MAELTPEALLTAEVRRLRLIAAIVEELHPLNHCLRKRETLGDGSYRIRACGTCAECRLHAALGATDAG